MKLNYENIKDDLFSLGYIALCVFAVVFFIWVLVNYFNVFLWLGCIFVFCVIVYCIYSFVKYRYFIKETEDKLISERIKEVETGKIIPTKELKKRLFKKSRRE